MLFMSTLYYYHRNIVTKDVSVFVINVKFFSMDYYCTDGTINLSSQRVLV